MTKKSRILLLAEFKLSFLTFLAAVALMLLACSDENLSGDDSAASKVNYNYGHFDPPDSNYQNELRVSTVY